LHWKFEVLHTFRAPPAGIRFSVTLTYFVNAFNTRTVKILKPSVPSQPRPAQSGVNSRDRLRDGERLCDRRSKKRECLLSVILGWERRFAACGLRSESRLGTIHDRSLASRPHDQEF